MSNSKNIIGGTFEDVNEAVVKPVTDEVGKAIESGVQSVVQGPVQKSAPQQPFEGKQLEDQKKLVEARRKIDWWKTLGEAQRKAREEERQKQMQRVQEEKKKQEVKQFTIQQKKRQLPAEIAARGKAEIKRGIGG